MAEKLSPQEIAEKQAQRLKASTADIERGISRVTEAPGMKAGAAQDKMLRNLTEAVNSGKWKERVESVSLDDWKSSAISKGIPRIAAGIDQAIPLMAQFHEQRQTHQSKIDGELERMPSTTLEDGINRATHQMREMAKMRFRR